MSEHDEPLADLVNQIGEAEDKRRAKHSHGRKHRPNISYECARQRGHGRCIDHDCECGCHE